MDLKDIELPDYKVIDKDECSNCKRRNMSHIVIYKDSKEWCIRCYSEEYGLDSEAQELLKRIGRDQQKTVLLENLKALEDADLRGIKHPTRLPYYFEGIVNLAKDISNMRYDYSALIDRKSVV